VLRNFIPKEKVMPLIRGRRWRDTSSWARSRGLRERLLGEGARSGGAPSRR
jgi:hypothetical protein